MAILINEKTKAIVQGIGAQGAHHLRLMRDYGTRIVGAVSRSKTGEFEGTPVYETIEEAATQSKADFSILFIPARFAKEAAIKALNSGLHVVIITERIPVHDTLEIVQAAERNKRMVIGPNCPGIISPGKSKIGIMPASPTGGPAQIFRQGPIGVVSRSGTLTYEIANVLSNQNLGQSTVVGIGGDSVIGLDFISTLKLFEQDKETEAIVLIGEIGGNMEESAAGFIKNGRISKPVVAYIAGRFAPKGKQMGHAGAIIEGSAGTAESKIKALENAGVKIASLPSEIPGLLPKG